ncbi:MAG: chromate transporter [Dehalococcoidia bacterium]|nr:chromate transporter [Dehalococcoidia bacterium]
MAREVLLLGMTGFGGGMSAHLFSLFVERRRWVNRAEFLETVTLAQVLPGPNIGNMAAILGYRVGGWIGGALALAAITVPGLAIVMALGWLYGRSQETPTADRFLAAVTAAALGLIVTTVARLIPGVRRSNGAWLLAVGAFLAFGIGKLPLVAVVLIGGALGVWLNRPGASRR